MITLTPIIMSNLNEYLAQKRLAVLERQNRLEQGLAEAAPLHANVTAEGRSGVRRIRIRDHQILTDSPEDYAGYNLGPSSPELQLGVLGSCLTHIFLIQAAHRQVPIERLSVDVTGRIDPRGGKPGYDDIPIYPHDIGYTVDIVSGASKADVEALLAEVERTCPILNLLQQPQTVQVVLKHTQPTADQSHNA